MAWRNGFILLIILEVIARTTGVSFLPSIQWTPDNPIFKNLKGQTRKVNTDDEINIWCPKLYTQGTKTSSQLHSAKLYFALYKVKTKEEYDNCDARKGKRLLYCTDPTGKSTEDTEERQITFMRNPLSNYHDPYQPGNTYYFIGTSGGTEEHIDKKVGGKCRSHNMKLAIYVCRPEEKCNVDVENGGWSLWKVNETTGLCTRNCTNPAPQNGGFPCRGEDKMDCSKIISRSKPKPMTTKESTTAKESTTETTTSRKTSTEQTSVQQEQNTSRKTENNANRQPTTFTKVVPVITKTTKMSESDANALDDEQESEGGDDDVTLSVKGAVLTFVGLFILGCIVGIVQVLLILHMRSKRSSKQPESQAPVNQV